MKIMIADDHSIVRMGLRLLIEEAFQEVCFEEAENGNVVMEKVKHLSYDLIILDFQMPNTDIFNVISYILVHDEKAKILVYTMASEKVYAPKLFAAGIKGFLSKEAENTELVKAVKIIVAGGVYGNPQGRPDNSAQQTLVPYTNPFSILSAKELNVLNFLIQGKNTKEISALSHLQMSTISTHKVRIFRKLNITNMVELLALAREHQLY